MLTLTAQPLCANYRYTDNLAFKLHDSYDIRSYERDRDFKQDQIRNKTQGKASFR